MLEVMDDAPDWLTWRERYVLMAMADNFNDNTRIGWPAYDGDGERSDKFRRRARCTRRQFYETLAELINKGVLVVEVSGHNGRQAVYRMPRLATAKPLPADKRKEQKPRKPKAAEAAADTHREGFQEPSTNAHGTLTEPSLGAENPHTTDDVVCGNDGSSVRRNRTPIPQVSSTLKELNTSSSASASPLADPVLADVPMKASDPSGLPAGHGAKAAPRGREANQSPIGGSTPPLQLVTDAYQPTLFAFEDQPPGLAAQWEAGRRAAAAAGASVEEKRSDEDERPDRVHLAALETIEDHEYVKLTREARETCPRESLAAVYKKAYELGIERGLIKAAA